MHRWLQRGQRRKTLPRRQTALWRISQLTVTSRPSGQYVALPRVPGRTAEAFSRRSPVYSCSARKTAQHSVTRVRLGPQRPPGHQTRASACVIHRRRRPPLGMSVLELAYRNQRTRSTMQSEIPTSSAPLVSKDWPRRSPSEFFAAPQGPRARPQSRFLRPQSERD